MNYRIKGIVTKVAKLVFALALLVWMVKSDILNLKVLSELLTHPVFVVAFFLITGLGLFINHYRWYLLLRAQGIDRGVAETAPLTLIGLFFNYAIPGSVGGDLVKAYYIAQDEPTKRLRAVFTVLMDRLVGLFAMLLVATVVMLFEIERISATPALKPIVISLLLIVFGFIVAFTVLFFVPNVQDWIPASFKQISLIKKLFDTLLSYRDCKSILLKTVLISIVGQAWFILGFYYIALTMGEGHVPIGAFFFVVPVALAISSVPLAPAGIGVGQLAFLFLFQLYTGEKGLQIGQVGITCVQVMQLGWGLFGAYFYLQRKPVIESEVRL